MRVNERFSLSMLPFILWVLTLIAGLAILRGVANYAAKISHETWKYIECGILLAIFVSGCWQLMRAIEHRQAT